MIRRAGQLFLAAVLFLPASFALAQTNPPADTIPPSSEEVLPVKPPPVPTGIVPLPKGSPNTSPQGPVPAPAQKLPNADHPLLRSPDLNSVNGYIANRAITLQDAVAIALYTNRDFAAAAAALQQAQGRAGQARAQQNPTLSARGDIIEYDSVTKANFGGQSFVIQPQFSPTLGANFSLPLDITGTLHAAISQAQFQEIAAQIDVNRVRNAVILAVKNAFYNVLRAQAQIAVAVDSLNNSLKRLDDANKNYSAGTSPRFDVISAQRDVANAQQDLINSQAQLSVNIAALKNTIGLNLRTKLRISDQNAVDYPAGVLPPSIPPLDNNGRPITDSKAVPDSPAILPAQTPEPRPAAPLVIDPSLLKTGIQKIPTANGSSDIVEDTFDFGPEFDALIQEAMKTRPEILEGDAQISAARKGVLFARRSSMPAFNIGLSDTYSPNPAAFTRKNVGAISLGISIPIFDGGLAREREKEARGVVANAEITRRRYADQVQVDVQQAYIALVQARNRVAVANVGLNQAREAFRLARIRYNTGVSQLPGISPQLEISNAQTSLAQAQSNQINALYDYNNSRAQLDWSIGRYAFTATGPGFPAPPPPGVRGISP